MMLKMLNIPCQTYIFLTEVSSRRRLASLAWPVKKGMSTLADDQ